VSKSTAALAGPGDPTIQAPIKAMHNAVEEKERCIDHLN
jgi:hypothetical protein